MEVPVCLEKRRVGTLTVTPSGADTVFRARCTGLPAGLYRLYACGDGGELLLGVKIESPEGVARCEEILAVPGLGFAEMGPGDLGLSLLGHTTLRLSPYPPEMQEARDRVFAACRANGVAFLESCTPADVAARIDEGVRVIAGGREETARAGRARPRW